MQQKQKGFTVVELLIVIVVIGVLASLTVVAYNGFTRSAAEASLKSDLRNAQKQLEAARIQSGNYPSNTTDIKKSSTTNFEYTSDNSSYCITASSSGTSSSFFFSSLTNVISEGTCPGHLGGGSPAPGPETLALSEITGGNTHTCAISEGEAYCWGSNFGGQLGNNSLVDTSAPVKVSSSGALAGRTVTDLSAGTSTSCAVADGAAYCWGQGDYGELGVAEGEGGLEGFESSLVPVAVSTTGALSGLTVTEVTSGIGHTCAIANGAAYCWGLNNSGQVGEWTSVDPAVPVPVMTSGVLNGRTVTAISAGGYHTCAIANGAAYCWGANYRGQLGDGSTNDSYEPVTVTNSGVLSGRTITGVAVGESHTCVLSGGLVYCWGSNETGQLGNNSSSDSAVPVAVSAGGVLSGRTVTAISAGSYHTCALADGSVYCWGSGFSGQLGDDIAESNVPVAVSTDGALSGRTITQIGTGFSHSCAISDGAAFCWGWNSAGQLGSGTTVDSPVPVTVSPLLL